MLNMLSIGFEEAENVIAAASTAALAMNVPQNIAVVDAAGHLVAFRRMDGAKFSSIDIALAKAYTAAGARKACAHRGHPVTDSDNIRSLVPI